MSWTNELYKVYENNCGRTDCEEPLLPISHSTANAQIEVTISEDGEFITASTVPKNEAVTIIPVTEDSGSRGNGIAPHPLNDKLIYIAGDYSSYTVGKNSDNTEYFAAYINQLQDWRESNCSHKGVDAVNTYLSKQQLVADLVKCKVLVLDDISNNLKEKIKIEGIPQEDAFVRFNIHYNELMHENRTWLDKSLYESFTTYYSNKLTDNQLCYATGEFLPCTYKHPSKIRNAGDKAKLISANDESGFSYRGRFDNKEQVLCVSYDFSQKMHIALKWLIKRQGIVIDSLVLLMWESALQNIPDITKSSAEEFDFGDDNEIIDTVPAYKAQLSGAIYGLRQKINKNSNVMISAYDAATPGRLSMTMYSEIDCSDFLSNIENWHMNTAWIRFNGRVKMNIINSFSMYDIAECAFGTEQNGFIKCQPEVKKDIFLRLIPCVTEGRNVPKDIVNALVHKASNPLAYNEAYNHRRVLETACGMIRKTIIEEKGECAMSFDETITDRSYLFGCLLAIADKAEYDTYDKEDAKSRVTNAKRYWSSFSQRPYQTWKIIEERLRPYLDKLGGYSVVYSKLLNSTLSKITYEDFTANKPLEPVYLLGYHCQLNELYKSKNEEDKK